MDRFIYPTFLFKSLRLYSIHSTLSFHVIMEGLRLYSYTNGFILQRSQGIEALQTQNKEIFPESD